MKNKKPNHFLALLPKPISPTYDKAVKKLCKIIAVTDQSHNKIILNHFEEFTQKFTTDLDIWIFMIRLKSDELWNNGNFSNKGHQKICEEIWQKFFEHFPRTFCLNFDNDCKNLSSQIDNFQRVILKNLVENAFYYELQMQDIFYVLWDEDKLKDSFIWYEANMTKLSSFKYLKKIKHSFDLYTELCGMFTQRKCNITKFIAAIEKTESLEYVIKNIEQNITTAAADKKWWKLYFYYSKKYCPIKLLDVYRRYCRLFVDDIKIRREYRKAIEEVGKHYDNTKWVLDSIKLEYDFGSEKAANKMIEKFVKEKNMDDSIILSSNFKENYKLLLEVFVKQTTISEQPKILKFQKNNIHLQTFAFPKPLINYFAQNANYEVTQKLQFSSKHMNVLINKIICLKLSISDLDKTQIHDEALFISTGNPEVENINNISVFNTLFVYFYKQPETLSKFIPKISKCILKFLFIGFQILTLNEYNFLTKSKTIKLLGFRETLVKNFKEEKASLENLMENLPLAEHIALTPSPLINFETFNALDNIKRKVKIQNFLIKPITEKFDTISFCYFIKKNAAPKSNILMLHSHLDECEYLQPSISYMLAEWEPSFEQPQLKIYKSY